MFKDEEIKKIFKWDIKALLIIYCVLTVLFFAVKFTVAKLPPPFNERPVPSEITPWLN